MEKMTKLKGPDKEYGEEYQAFIDENGGEGFPELSFRPGAPFTSSFGWTERYRVDNGKTDDNVSWGYPGIHRGADRGGDVEISSPFDFGSSGFVDYKGRGFGSSIMLYHRLDFRVMIAHCFPEEVRAKQRLQEGLAIEKGTIIAKPGSYGFSTGRHTHTEIEAWGFGGEWLETCQVLDWVLYGKHGEKSITPYTQEEIIQQAMECKMVRNERWNAKKIMDYFEVVQREKRIVFLNEYKYIYEDNAGRLSTRYSSRALFGM